MQRSPDEEQNIVSGATSVVEEILRLSKKLGVRASIQLIPKVLFRGIRLQVYVLDVLPMGTMYGYGRRLYKLCFSILARIRENVVNTPVIHLKARSR